MCGCVYIYIYGQEKIMAHTGSLRVAVPAMSLTQVQLVSRAPASRRAVCYD